MNITSLFALWNQNQSIERHSSVFNPSNAGEAAIWFIYWKAFVKHHVRSFIRSFVRLAEGALKASFSDYRARHAQSTFNSTLPM